MGIRISIIKKIDRLIGPVLLNLIPKMPPQQLTDKISRILIIRPGGMGDAFLLLPILSWLKSNYSEIWIDVLCEKRNVGVFKSVNHVDQILLYTNPVDWASLIRRQYDVVFDTEQSHYLSAITARIIKSYCRLGFAVNGREKMYHITVDYDHQTYELDMFCKLFGSVFNMPKIFKISPPYFIYTNKSDKLFDLLEDKKEIVCLFPGASIKERHWPEKRWAQVAEYLFSEGYQPIFLGGKPEVSLCERIKAHCSNDKIISLAGQLSVIETVWLFEKTNLLISTDSGILHLGVICGLPTISLFGPGIETKWAPKGEHHIVINKKLNCSPCTLFGSTPKCLNGNACMISITYYDVVHAVEFILCEDMIFQ